MKPLKKHIEELEAKAAQATGLEGMDSYEILGINKDTSAEEVEKQYKNLAKAFHPDRYTKDTGTIFKAIEEAYRTLTKKPEDKIASSSNKEEKEEDTDAFFLSEKLDDYQLEPEGEFKEKEIEENQTATNRIVVYDKDKADEEVGRRLILANYAPYIGYTEFTKLNRKDQKELALLLGRQKQRYCDALEAKYIGIDFSRISIQTINYNSVDLDSESFLPEERDKIILLTQRAHRGEHSLGDKLALTTEVIATESPNLYLSGWLLLHAEPGMSSGALGLFRTWGRNGRKSLAIAIGNAKLRYSKNHLMSILKYYERSVALESSINAWSEQEYDITKHGNKDKWEDEQVRKFHQLPSQILIHFVKQLKRFNVPKDDNYWYQRGRESILKGDSDLSEYAFSLLSEKAQRYVAIGLAKKREYLLVLRDVDRLVAWANTIERAEKEFLYQIKEGKASIKESEFIFLSDKEKRTIVIKESLMMDLNGTEPEFKEELYDERNILLDEEDLHEIIKDCVRRIPEPIKEDKGAGKGMEACRSLPDDSKSEILEEEKKSEIETIASPKEKIEEDSKSEPWREDKRAEIEKTASFKEEIELDKEVSSIIMQNEELWQKKLEDVEPIPHRSMDEDIVLSDLEDEATQDASYIEEHGIGKAIVSSQLDEYPQDLSAEPQNSIDEVIKPQPLDDKEQDLCSLRQDLINNPAQDSGSLRQDHRNNPMIALSFFESVSRTVAQFQPQSQSQSQYIVYMLSPKRRRRM